MHCSIIWESQPCNQSPLPQHMALPEKRCWTSEVSKMRDYQQLIHFWCNLEVAVVSCHKRPWCPMICLRSLLKFRQLAIAILGLELRAIPVTKILTERKTSCVEYGFRGLPRTSLPSTHQSSQLQRHWISQGPPPPMVAQMPIAIAYFDPI